MMIYVCNLVEMPSHVAALKPSHIVSLMSPNTLPDTPAGIAPERHHKVAVHDISAPLEGHVAPDVSHVEGLVAFVRDWPHEEAPLLVHCFAGISRSTAAALITLVVKAPGRELEAARKLRAAAPHAHPNPRLIAMADEVLACRGRLIAAHEAMGPGDLMPWGSLTTVPLLD